jgi:hypothetical protein
MIIEGTIIELFEEALGLESPRIMEEDVAPPRSDMLPLSGMRSNPCGTPSREDTRKSPPFHHDAQLIHPLHHHTL